MPIGLRRERLIVIIRVHQVSQPDLLLVGEASSGTGGIRKFKEQRPDVTLMDLRLPDMSGVDALIAIRTDAPDARIIMLTTFEGGADVQRALEAGASAYLLKSMRPRELVNAIRQVHAGKKLAG